MTRPAPAFEGRAALDLALALGLPRVEIFRSVGSTLDVAHELAAAGAPAGTLVLADAQTAGRGRGGRRWTSPPGGGIWLTLLERPNDPRSVEVLALRVGLAAARVLDRFAGGLVSVKWPNDLYVGDKKLAGTLVEARWRDARLDWVALGFGVNIVPPPEVPAATGLAPGASRLNVLTELVPALRAASAARGALSPGELAAFTARDCARGRRAREPGVGRVAGITGRGALLITEASGDRAYRSGSLVLEEEGV